MSSGRSGRALPREGTSADSDTPDTLFVPASAVVGGPGNLQGAGRFLVVSLVVRLVVRLVRLLLRTTAVGGCWMKRPHDCSGARQHA